MNIKINRPQYHLGALRPCLVILLILYIYLALPFFLHGSSYCLRLRLLYISLAPPIVCMAPPIVYGSSYCLRLRLLSACFLLLSTAPPIVCMVPPIVYGSAYCLHGSSYYLRLRLCILGSAYCLRLRLWLILLSTAPPIIYGSAY